MNMRRIGWLFRSPEGVIGTVCVTLILLITALQQLVSRKWVQQ